MKPRRCSAILAAPLACGACALALANPVAALPAPGDFADVPSRTSLSFEHTPTGVHVGTENENESRPGLSTVKLYMADYALRYGDGSQSDRDLAARMIQASDDDAASRLDAKYPQAIDAAAAEYGLTSTSRGSFWGSSYTSAADTVRFLEAKKRTDPDSPIPGWMNSASSVAADGTDQDWGTGMLADVTGTKWRWSDYGPSVVASASIGDGFSIAANTYGSASAQTDDVLGAVGDTDLTPLPVPPTPTVLAPGFLPPGDVPPLPSLPPLPPLPTVEQLLQMMTPR